MQNPPPALSFNDVESETWTTNSVGNDVKPENRAMNQKTITLMRNLVLPFPDESNFEPEYVKELWDQIYKIQELGSRDLTGK
jgi:hypothetical protein